MARDVLARLAVSGRLLDPLERTCEILFGVIVVLTFTGSISVATGGTAETRTILIAAIGCNLAWGIVDAAMFLMSNYAERTRALSTLRAARHAPERESAHRLILDTLPPVIARVLTAAEVETLRERLDHLPEVEARAVLKRADYGGALGVFLLVSLSTLPVVAPFLLISRTALALRVSNAVAIAMLFGTGWSLGRYAGQSGWRSGLSMVALGLVLMITTIALGG